MYTKLFPTTILRGLRCVLIPLFGGNAFNIITIFFTVSFTITRGIAFFHGKLLIAARIRSFTVRIIRSISPTCSNAAGSLKIISCSSFNIGFNGENSSSPSAWQTLNPRRLYKLITDCKHFIATFKLLVVTYSTVQNLILRDVVIKNIMLFTNMKSNPIVTFLCNLINSGGTCTWSSSTLNGVLRVVFPLSAWMSFPKIFSAISMSSTLTGQSCIKLYLIAFLQSSTLG